METNNQTDLVSLIEKVGDAEQGGYVVRPGAILQRIRDKLVPLKECPSVMGEGSIRLVEYKPEPADTPDAHLYAAYRRLKTRTDGSVFFDAAAMQHLRAAITTTSVPSAESPDVRPAVVLFEGRTHKVSEYLRCSDSTVKSRSADGELLVAPDKRFVTIEKVRNGFYKVILAPPKATN